MTGRRPEAIFTRSDHRFSSTAASRICPPQWAVPDRASCSSPLIGEQGTVLKTIAIAISWSGATPPDPAGPLPADPRGIGYEQDRQCRWL